MIINNVELYIMIKKFILLLVLILNIFPLSLYISPVYAKSDFEISSDLTIDYRKGNDYVTLSEKVKFEVNNEDYFLRRGAKQIFYIPDFSTKEIEENRNYKLKNLIVKDMYNEKMKFVKSTDSNGILIEVTIPVQVSSFEEYSITISYKSKDLINLSGNIANLYIPGLASDTQFTSISSNKLTTTRNYTARVITSKDVALPSYTQPTNIKLTQTEKENIYTIDPVDRIGKTSWIQFGTSQYYRFKLVQEALKTDNITPEQISNIAPIVSTNVYKIALPREYDENSQNILIKSISPQPSSIERDQEGNLIAIFDTPANKDSKIIVEGFIEISKKQFDKGEKIKDLNLADYKAQVGNMGAYTQPEEFIESQDPFVKEIADKLYSKSSSILELVRNNYNYVVKEFDYSYSKLSQGNIRLGAKAALSGSQTICMEYADALTAIFRAQGIPARTAIGYGNDPHNSENVISNSKLIEQLIGHQWVQVWIPQYGWLSVDPTWGESNRTYIGSDLDHILWYTQSPSSNDITDVIFYSAERSNLGKYQVFLQALDKQTYDKESQNSQTLSQLNIKQQSGELPIDFYLKTSFAGRIIIYLLPLFATVIISILITTIIYIVKGKVKKKP